MNSRCRKKASGAFTLAWRDAMVNKYLDGRSDAFYFNPPPRAYYPSDAALENEPSTRLMFI
jgi:hypothetical protein